MKKGLTLVELIAVLTILAIIALIITPNIMVSVKEYKDQAYETEIQAIEGSAKNWAADHIDEIPSPTDDSIVGLYVSIDELVDEGYFEENAADPKGGKFDDNEHDTFVIINCELIRDEFGVKKDNYKYTYEAYTSEEEYLEKKLLKYAKDNELKTNNSDESDIIITGSQLLEAKYFPATIYKYNVENELYEPVKSSDQYVINVKRTGRNEETYEYEYSVTIN